MADLEPLPDPDDPAYAMPEWESCYRESHEFVRAHFNALDAAGRRRFTGRIQELFHELAGLCAEPADLRAPSAEDRRAEVANGFRAAAAAGARKPITPIAHVRDRPGIYPADAKQRVVQVHEVPSDDPRTQDRVIRTLSVTDPDTGETVMLVGAAAEEAEREAKELSVIGKPWEGMPRPRFRK